jgi:uncharacterized repeat protein (TIGR01451 family)
MAPASADDHWEVSMKTESRHSKRAGLSALAAMGALGVLAAPAMATVGNPTTSDKSNLKCSDYGLTGFKPTPESNPTGTHTVPGTNGKTITVTENQAQNGISWTSTLGIDKVLVKGGPGFNIYSYSPESFGATGLITRNTPSGGPAGLSHVEFCYDLEVLVSKTAVPSYDRDYDWTIEKDVDKSSVTTSGDNATFKYTVNVTKSGPKDSNFVVKGQIKVDNPFAHDKSVVITDDILGRTDENCTISGAVNGAWTAKASSVTSFNYTCTLPTKVDGTNKVTITWGDGKTDSFQAPFTFGDPSKVTDNTANVTDKFNGGESETLGANISASDSYTYDRKVDAVAGECVTYPNVATVTPSDSEASGAEKSVQVCKWAALKTASPSFDRAFDWNILKSVVGASSVTTSANTVEFSYKVDVTKSAGVDSNFTVGGAISIDNPGTEPMDVIIADDILGRTDETCMVEGANQNGTWTIPAAGASFKYSCTLPTKVDGTNKVTISLPQGEGPAQVLATATAGFAFDAPIKVTNNSVDVTDNFNSTGAALLTAGDDITGSQSFTYKRTVTVPTTGCTTFPNIANIMSPDGLNKSANASVEACREVPPVTPQPQSQPQPQPAVAIAGATVAPKAGLKVTKTGPRAATAGQIVTYTITVKNTGKANATSVVLRDLLPSGFSLAGKANGASFKAGTLSWKFGTLAPGKSKTVKAKFRIDRSIGGRRCNVATAAASGVSTVRDTACTRIAAVAGAVQPAVTG